MRQEEGEKCVEGLELQTSVREDFTIKENTPIGPSPD